MSDLFHFCFITDDGYVTPTIVAIRSLIENGLNGQSAVVHVVAADLSDENAGLFGRCDTDHVRIDVIRTTAERLRFLHRNKGNMCVATPAALLKFSLGELLPDVERVLYLDGDILVAKSLASLFDIDLGPNVLAAAPDTGAIYCRRPIHDEVRRYFNSGVMLLDLVKMRGGGYAQRLLAAKASSSDHLLMDQDVFNRVFNSRWLEIPPRYNFLFLNLLRARAFGCLTMSQFNAEFGTSYDSLAELDDDAAIIHFSSKDKPWKYRDVPYASQWRSCYGRSSLADRPLVRTVLPEDWPVRLPLEEASVAKWWCSEGPQQIRTVGLLCRSLAKGGLERAMSVQVPMFARMGMQVVVMTDLPVSDCDFEIDVPYRRVCLSVSDDDPIGHGAALRRVLQEEHVDLLLHNDAYCSWRLAADIRAAQTLGIPVAVYWHNVFSHFFLRPGSQAQARPLFEACRGARVIFTHTKTDECFFRMYGLPALKNALSAPDFMRGFRRVSYPHRLLWMGRMVETKRPLHALEIFRRVYGECPEAELVMLGDGDPSVMQSIRNWLRIHPDCAAAVRMEGFQKDVRPYLESSGVGLVTSRFEGFCYSLVEMKMAALPVVAYEMPYLDTLKENSGAFCVPQEDVESAAQAVLRLFSDHAEFHRQSTLARASYEEIASTQEGEIYRRFVAHLEGGDDIDLASIDPVAASRAVVTLVDHMQIALRIKEQETVSAWFSDRSYRLGRVLTWPYRVCKRWFRGGENIG